WFNTAAAVVLVAVGGGVLVLCQVVPGPGAGSRPDLALIAPLAALAMCAANVMLVELVLVTQLGRPSWRTVRERWLRAGMQEGTLYLLGLLFVSAAVHAPWSLALMALPLVVVYRSLHATVALRASEARLRTVLQHSVDLVFIVDGDGQLQHVSAAATAV